MADEIVENDVNNNVDTQTEEKPKMSYEELEAELRRVRHEAAGKRVTIRDLEEKAKRWEEYEDSQKTELQKLQEALAERDRKLSDYQLSESKKSIIKEYELDDDDLDLLTGSDDESNRKIAEKLKAKAEKLRAATEKTTGNPIELLAGNRGAPIGNSSTANFDNVLRAMARNK